MQAVILAAGESTRTWPLTQTVPKPLLPIANKPILAYHLDALQGLADEAIIVVGYKKEMIKNHFGELLPPRLGLALLPLVEQPGSVSADSREKNDSLGDGMDVHRIGPVGKIFRDRPLYLAISPFDNHPSKPANSLYGSNVYHEQSQ